MIVPEKKVMVELSGQQQRLTRPTLPDLRDAAFHDTVIVNELIMLL